MTTCNGERFLAEQLDSILGQRFTDFELVIADDASTDGTRRILEIYAAKDARIRLFFHDINLGYRENFRFAIAQCRAELVLLSDQDDRWLPHKMDTLLKELGDDLLVFSDSVLTDEHGKRLDKKLSDAVNMLQPGTDAVNRGFVTGNCVWGHTVLFRKALLQYAEAGRAAHPHDWWLAVVSSHLKRIKYCKEVLNEYRQHADNLTHALPRNREQGLKKDGVKERNYATELARLKSIMELPFNTDRAFYERWHALYLCRQQHFSFSLFFFLLKHQRDVFRMKRKHALSRLVEIRKMSRKTILIPS